jgi:hypothetical protein
MLLARLARLSLQEQAILDQQLNDLCFDFFSLCRSPMLLCAYFLRLSWFHRFRHQ